MARLDRIAVSLNTSAEIVGHLENEPKRWAVHCDIEGCTVTPDDFVTTYLTAAAALDQLVDHLTEDHELRQ
jgi:hypothetical protein